FEHMHTLSVGMRENSAQPGHDLNDSIDQYINFVSNSRRSTRYISAHGLGIREGLSCDQARQAYLRHILLPSIESIAQKLVRTPDGPRNYQTARLAGVMLLGSSIFMILLQDLLNGATHAPLDIDLYFEQVKKWMKSGIGSNLNALTEN
ncbi:MAG: hypothetical protein RLN72_03770, partial [Henriciella sp.]